MNELRQQKIAELQRQHDLPTEILSQIVDEAGTVDTARLGIALQTRQFVQSGMTAQNGAEIEGLKTAYKEAQARRDGVAMVKLQSRIYELGGRW
jgi:hypothetical protein